MTPPPLPAHRGLWAELRRRNVFRMAALYLVGAWLIVQVAETLLPIFDTPGWALKALVVLLAIGLAPALLFSWIYELTPEGVKRDAAVPPAGSVAPQTARRMDRVLLLVMALALGYFVIDRFVPAPSPMTSRSPTTASDAAAIVPIAGPDSRAASDASAAAPKHIVRGIAVLPFDNLSPDPDNAYLAGGVYEEVLTKLSRIAELRVISRTSMERVAEDKLDVGAIGQRLGVSHVLEGSVRRARDQIRVTVQLIEAATDNHIWAESYDRELDDVFAIQSEIALAIAGQLEISLSPQLQANLSERPTRNPAAYALYLRALDERRGWRGAVGFQAIIDLLEPAMAADPGFLDAAVLLAESYGRMVWLNADPDGRFAGKAQQQVADILRRWPDHPLSQFARGQLLYNLERDYAQALNHLEAARARLPNDPHVLSSLASGYKRLDRIEESLDVARRVVELDPESARATFDLVQALLGSSLLDEALAVSERGRRRFPYDRSFVKTWAYAKMARDQDISTLLALDSAPWFARDLAIIARYIRGDVEALTQPVSGTDRSRFVFVHALTERAELLALAGRGEEAQTFADQARAVVEENLTQPGPRSPRVEAFWNLLAANVLALTGEPGRARGHLAQARRNPPRDDRHVFDAIQADTERRLGDPEAAWLLIQPYARQPQYLSHGELLALQAYYDQFFGESPSYRAYMAKIAGEKR